jgi:hypothetical protein
MGVSGKGKRAVLAGRLIAGTKKRFPNGSQTLTFGGVDHTADEVTTFLQGIVDDRAAVEAAQATANAKVAAEDAKEAARISFLNELASFLRITFGTVTGALVDFGLAPPKARVPMTAEAKAIAAAKRDATRKARGITTKKARKAITGQVTAKLVVTAPAADAAPSPVATPAPRVTGGA